MRKLLLLCIAVMIAVCVYAGRQSRNTGSQQIVFADSRELILEWMEPYYCQMVSENVGICDLPAYINMVVSLLQEGYIVEKYEKDNQVYDYILSAGEGDKFRLYYDSDGRVTSIAFHYEDSARPFTYINEGGRSELRQGEN